MAQSPGVSRDGGELSLAQLVTRESGPGVTDVFKVPAAAGQFVYVAIQKQTVEVMAVVLDPGGTPVLTADSPNMSGPASARWIAPSSGIYLVRVAESARSRGRGRYQIELKELREALPGDQRWIAAQTKLSDAAAKQRAGDRKSQEESLALYLESAPLWRDLHDSYGEAVSLQNAGRLSADLGEPQKSLDLYAQALPLWRAAADKANEAATLAGSGAAYYSLGEQEKSLEQYRAALPLWRAAGDRTGQLLALHNIGSIHSAQGDPQQALDYHQQALTIARAAGDRSAETTALSALGNVYRDLGAEQKAIEFYQRALPLERAGGDRFSESNTLIAFGDAYFFLGERQKSLDYYQQALTLKRALRDASGEALTLIGIGNVYSDLGARQKRVERPSEDDQRKALDVYEQALVIGKKIGDPSVDVFGRMGAGVAYSALGDKQKAYQYINQALFVLNFAKFRPGIGWALYEKARVERDRGNLAQARTLVMQSRNIIEGLRTKMISQELRATFVAAVHDCYELEIDVLMKLHAAEPAGGHQGEALTASERARARVLLETLSEAHADIRAGVDPGLLEQEHALEVQINAKEMVRIQMLGSNRSNEQVAAVSKTIAELTGQYEDVRTAIRSRSPHYAALNYPQPLNVAEIQRDVLDGETLLLEYALGEQQGYLWAVSSTGMVSVTLPKRSEIEEAARRYRDALTNSGSTASLDTGQELSRMLLGEVAANLGNKRLLVVADGALQYLPFAALPDPNALQQPLVVNHEIVSIPSASTLAVLRRENANRKPAPKTLAILADPVFSADDPRLSRARDKQTAAVARVADESLQRSITDLGLASPRLPRLPGTRREATAISALIPQPDRRVALDFDASRAMLNSKEIADYRILHLATHGLLNSAHPELSGVVLSLVDGQGKAQDGFLRLHEIYNLRLSADLVVLSACQTGLGKEVRGEGLVGLTRGFMYAGAQGVVASLWKVDDRATAELMKRFYGNMLGDNNLRPAAALRAAQTAMWRTKGWESPYNWAAFVLQGDWK